MPLNAWNDTVPTVFLVDDDDDFRESLRELVAALGHCTRAFASGEAFEEFYDSQPGCLILDLSMPGKSGLDLYQELVSRGKMIPVIFVTAHADVRTAVAAMKTGAIEFLEKPFDRVTLESRLEKALKLDRQWRTSEAEFVALNSRMEALTETDRETLGLLVTGFSNKQMAAQWMISERAVELRRARLMRKLRVRSLAELLELTIKHRVAEEARALSNSGHH